MCVCVYIYVYSICYCFMLIVYVIQIQYDMEQRIEQLRKSHDTLERQHESVLDTTRHVLLCYLSTMTSLIFLL